jgi:ankyrin repeat protein
LEEWKNQPGNKDRYRAFVTVLLESGSDPNAIDKYGYTPLYSTIINRQFGLSRLLLEYGADPDQETSENIRPYELFYKRYMDAGYINKDEEFAKLVIELNKWNQRKVSEGG